MFVEMNLAGVRIELPSNQPIVLLREAGSDRFLPIWIGQPEAASIAMAVQGVAPQRLESTEARLEGENLLLADLHHLFGAQQVRPDLHTVLRCPRAATSGSRAG